MNYAKPEVRAHQMAFVRELLERYDPDGLELDWMRFGHHLTPGKEREEAHILTDFVRDVRKLTEAWSTTRGHRIALGVRVPAHPDAAAGLGMDGVTWAREGLVDMLVPCPFWSSSDFDIPVELWRERLGADSPVVIAPGLEFNARPWPGGKPVANDLGTLYGFAESARFRGADSFYLFNFMDSGTRPVPASAYRTIVEKGVDTGTTRAAVRRFPVCYRDTVPAGFPNGSCLPIKGRRGGTFTIPIGNAPGEGSGHVVLGLAAAEGIGETVLAVTLNGAELPPAPDLKTCAGLGGGSARAIRAAIPLELLRDGYNDVAVKQTDDGPEATVVWAELRLTP